MCSDTIMDSDIVSITKFSPIIQTMVHAYWLPKIQSNFFICLNQLANNVIMYTQIYWGRTRMAMIDWEAHQKVQSIAFLAPCFHKSRLKHTMFTPIICCYFMYSLQSAIIDTSLKATVNLPTLPTLWMVRVSSYNLAPCCIWSPGFDRSASLSPSANPSISGSQAFVLLIWQKPHLTISHIPAQSIYIKTGA